MESISNEGKQKTNGKQRCFAGRMGLFITVATVALAAFQLYTAFFGVLPAMQQRSIHMAFVLPLIFLLYPMRKASPKSRPSVWDWSFAAMSAICTLYIFFMYENIVNRAGMYSQYELYLGAAMIFLVFEATRRVLGYPLPIFCSLFILFAYFGRSMPGP